MAADLNNVSLVGNLTKDIELNENKTVGRISIAFNTNEKQQDGSWTDVVSYVSATLFGKRAAVLQQYLTKGTKVGVSGFLKQNSWTDKNGNKRYELVVIANEIYFLGQRKQSQSGTPTEYSGSENASSDIGFDPSTFTENIPF